MSTEVDPEKNPLLPGVENPGYDGTGEEIDMEKLNPYDSSSQRGSVDPTSSNRTQDETSFSGGKITQKKNDTSQYLIQKLKDKDDAWEIIKRKFPNVDTAESSFTATLDEFRRPLVRLNRVNGDYHLLFDKHGKLKKKLPKTIIDSLGPSAEDIIKTNEEEIERRNKKIGELQD